MNNQDSDLIGWLKTNKLRWRFLQEFSDAYGNSKDDDKKQLLAFVQGHRSLARDVSMSRNAAPGSAMTRYLETLFLQTHDLLYRPGRSPKWGLTQLYFHDIPALFRSLSTSIIATVTLFVLSGVAGFWLVSTYPELISLFASEAMIETVQGGELWTDDLMNIMPSSVLAFQIMTNNIAVSIFAFVLGALYGLGTIYIIAMNGFMLGSVFAFTGQYDLSGRLFDFVFAHGVVELSVICLAGAAGVQLGEALMRPGLKGRGDAFKQAVSNAGKFLAVIIPFLVGAGLIEGYISPNASYTREYRVVIGVCYGMLLWGVLSGHLWQLLRPKSKKKFQT